jgi:hypothetical protein
MSLITKTLQLVKIDKLNGVAKPIAYVPVAILEKNVPVVVTPTGFDGAPQFDYSFMKNKKKHTRGITVGDTVNDGDTMHIVLGECQVAFPWKTKSGKTGTIAVGEQKLMLKPTDFAL